MQTPQNITQLRALRASGAPLAYRFFLGYQPAKNGAITSACLSQWWPCQIKTDRRIFTSAEHYMMFEKAMLFGDAAMAEHIYNTDHPFEAKMLGRQVRGFDEARWNLARFNIVIQGNIAKFGQTPGLLAYLINTGNDILAEASPSDLVWGTGCSEDDPIAAQPENWPGQNLLGFALMLARVHLRPAITPASRDSTNSVESSACPSP